MNLISARGDFQTALLWDPPPIRQVSLTVFPSCETERGFPMSKFLAFFQDETGASAAEYALILAIVGAGIAVASIALGTSISTAMNTAGNCITNPSAANC